MKVGDLVKPWHPTRREAGKVFLITESSTNWIMLWGYPGFNMKAGWHRMSDWQVISASR